MNETMKESSLEQQFSFTVGNITGEGVTLVDKEYNVIQLPKSLLPMGSVSGSVIRMTLRRDVEMERKEEEQINALIQKLQAGEHVGDTIIGIQEDLDISVREAASKEKNDKKPPSKDETNPKIKVAKQVKVQQKPAVETGMKKKPKIEPVQQQKPQSIKQLDTGSLSSQKSAPRQKSGSRRTSSAMKKVKSQRQQNS